MGGFLDQLSWRLVGPHRGGRVVAVAGYPQERSTFYFGSTGGGVWCTTDAGSTWRNVSDGFFRRAAVGAIALAPSEPSVIYAGMGESTIRNNASSGDGVYRSVNGGLTWTHLGLEATRHISTVRVDPTDSNVAYVAALGHAHGPNPERGVYRTRDGGATWDLVLHRGEDSGAADLCLDPRNPRILYATMWQGRRLPWRMDSGGPGSGLWRSVDGGDTWEDLCRGPACPRGSWAGPGWQHPGRGRARSVHLRGPGRRRLPLGDAGRPWERLIRPRADPARLVLQPHLCRSRNAERSGRQRLVPPFADAAAPSPPSRPHGDYHDLWIDPADPGG